MPADSTSVASDLLDTRAACPQCGAAVRADAPWCTQCFFDLRPAPKPAIEPSAPLTTPATAAYGAIAADPLTAPLSRVTEQEGPADQPAPTWPCTACETPNPYDRDDCAACGQGFLAGIHAGDVALVIPGVGDLADMSPRRALALAFAGIALVMLLVLVLGALFS